MKRIHAIALTAASAAFIGLTGPALAQNVTGADPYVQGYAAGATAKERNSFEAFDNGYRAAQTQNNMQSATNSALAYDNGYQAGVAAGAAQANNDQRQAYNEGYETRGQQDQRMADRAFDNGFDAGAYHRSHRELDFP
ncbi:MAG TPA: hypothetical protein VH189_02985 [Rhizomicrobium sp.]|nr:hypothetical protein [Rhizomicrobium sp.]